MLEQLDDLPWGTLYPTVPDAARLPEYLRALSRASFEEALYLYQQLRQCLIGPDGAQPIAAEVVPFLYELLDRDATNRRPEVVLLLVEVAFGEERAYWTQERSLDGLLEGWEAAQNWAAIEAYEAVREGLPILRAVVQNDHDYLGAAALYALGLFPDQAEQTLPLLRDYLGRLAPSREVFEVDALLVLSFLMQQLGIWEAYPARPVPPTEEDAALLVAARLVSAARPLSHSDARFIAQHVFLLPRFESEGFYFDEELLPAYLVGWLSHCLDEELNTVLLATQFALEQCAGESAHLLTQVLMNLLCRTHQRPLTELPVTSLTVLELDALRLIVEKGNWDGEGHEAYAARLRQAGLPDSRRAIVAYLDHD